MILDKSIKILIVGLGLIGGSYADALSSQGYEVGAIDKREASIEYAKKKGIIAHGTTQIDEKYISGFNLIVFALYPHILTEWIEENQKFIKSGTLLTDVTGVKCAVVYPVQAILRPDLEFIGAHPMAGTEASGVENSSGEIFKGANYIVTPTEKNTAEATKKCIMLGKTLGFEKISTLSPEKHDEMIGFLSQLTHCIAISLMLCKDTAHLAEYTGNSFRDLTRIAKINDVMWSELFSVNEKELLSQIDIFTDKLTELRQLIENGDKEKMREMMRLSTQRREYFDNY